MLICFKAVQNFLEKLSKLASLVNSIFVANFQTIEEHMQFSFLNIRKVEKRKLNPRSDKMEGSRIVLLQFHPPKPSHNSKT